MLAHVVFNLFMVIMEEKISLNIISFDCQGFSDHTHYYVNCVKKFFAKCDFLFLYKHWLTPTRFEHFSNVNMDACYTVNT